jgi:hypothetical protein
MCSEAGFSSQNVNHALRVCYKDQRSVVYSLWAKWLSAMNTHKEMFPVYGGKSLSHKTVHNWVDKFSQRLSKVTDDA